MFYFLNTRFLVAYLPNVPIKRLLRDLIDIVFPDPSARSRFSAGPGKVVLPRVKRMCAAPGAKTFFIKLHSGYASSKS